MPFTRAEKVEFYNDVIIPLTNAIRGIESLAVKHGSHREIEVRAACMHTQMEELRKRYDLPFRESDMDPSIFGENGDKTPPPTPPGP